MVIKQVFSVITSPCFWKEIERVISSMGEEILFQKVDTDIDLSSELEKVSRIAVKYLILDISAVTDQNRIKQAVMNYKIKKENTRIIIIAPNVLIGNPIMSFLFSLGVMDFISPQGEKEQEFTIEEELKEVLSRQPLYTKGVKWFTGAQNEPNDHSKLDKSGTGTSSRVIVKEVIKSVFKQIIAVYSPYSQGASTAAAHVAAALSQNGNFSVCLIDFNPLKPWQRYFFESSQKGISDVLECIIKENCTLEKIRSCISESRIDKKLDILHGITDLNDYYIYELHHFETLLEKVKGAYDYVVVDTNSFADIFPTHAALKLAEKIIVPVKGNKYSILETQRILKTFEKYEDYEMSKFSLVINQYGPKDLTYIEIESLSEYPILGYVSKFETETIFGKKQMRQYIDLIESLEIPIQKKKHSLFKRN